MRRALRSAIDVLGRLAPRWLIVIAFLLVGVIVFASYLISVDIRFSFFYLLPIALTSWFVGRRAGIVFSFLSAAAWFTEYCLEHVSTPEENLVAAEETVLLLGFYLLLSILLSTLSGALGRERTAARRDPLTQIPNRRAFFELAETEIQRVARYGGRFTVAYMDLDNFKQVNDRDGHETGDRVLVLASEAMRKGLRVNDIVARIGGDEFIVLLPETGAPEADSVFRKVENQIASVMRAGNWPVTVSVGAATFEKVPESVEQMVRVVDELMYCAKMKGKNRLEKRVIGA